MPNKSVPPVQPVQQNPAPSVPAESTAPQPTMSITSASELATRFTARFAALAAYQKSLNRVAALYANMLKNPRGVPTQKDAIADLDIYETDLDGVRQAIADMTHVDAQTATEFANWFEGRTGRKFDPKTLNYANAVKEETAEDQEQTREARLLGDTALAIIRDLGVTNTYNVTPDAVQKPKRGSLLVGFFNTAGEKFSKPQPKVEPETPTADWLTPLYLGEKGTKKDEFASLMKFMGRLQEKMQQYADQPNMRTVVIDLYANAGISREDIEDRLAKAQKLSAETLEQTNQILTLVGQDQQHFADWVDGLVDFRHVYGGVAMLFFPNK